MFNTTKDEENKVIEPVTFAKLDNMVKELYSTTFAEKAEGKMGNSSLISLLNEIEKMIDFYINDFNYIDTWDASTVLHESKKIQREKQ